MDTQQDDIRDWTQETFFQYLKNKFDLVFTQSGYVVTREAAEREGLIYFEKDLLTRILEAGQSAGEI